jgi:hypothetical protein
VETTSNPTVVNAAIEEALKEAPVQVETVAPSNSDVNLPGGYISQDGSLTKYAEVRELNGSDEEAIAKAGSVGRVLNTILQRGLVSLGQEKITKDTFDDLLAADREAILLGIRKVTFGETADYNLYCSECGKESLVSIDLDKDVPVSELQDPIADRKWDVEIKAGIAKVTLPNGRTQRLLMENSDKTVAELNTILLEGCLLGINGKGSLGASTVLKLGMGDREKLVSEILTKNPGPRLGEVMKTCEACGTDVNTPLSLMSLFRL